LHLVGDLFELPFS